MKLNLFKKKEKNNLVSNFIKYYAKKTKNIIPYSDKIPKWKKVITKNGEEIPGITLEQLINSKNILVVTGAGISVASGLPAFRGKDSSFKIPLLIEIIKNPSKIIEYHNQIKEYFRSCKPNEAHYALKNLEDYYLSKNTNFILVTQNVDGLHKMAGNKNIIEMHGNLFEYRCIKENKVLPETKVNFVKNVAYCDCGSPLRPNVVLFGEKLDKNKINKMFWATSSADMGLFIGTSGFVEPVNMIAPLMYNRGAYTIEINSYATLNSPYMFNLIEGKCEETLSKLVEKLKNGK